MSARVCLVCNRENSPDAEKCVRCGSPLKVSDTLLFRGSLPDDILDEFKAYEVDVEPGTIALHFVGKGQPLVISGTDEITLGRGSGYESSPTIDLTDYHGGLLGVSRLHAGIYPSEDGYVIEDLDSANGTWVNEERLTAHQPHELTSGDRIRLGDLLFFVLFA